MGLRRRLPVDQFIDLGGGNISGPGLALRLDADMPALPSRAALLQRSQHQARCRRHQAPFTGNLDAVVGWSVLSIMACTASGPPSVSAACLCQLARCSSRLRGSCLASRVSKVACCAAATPLPVSAVDHDHAETWPPAHPAGP